MPQNARHNFASGHFASGRIPAGRRSSPVPPRVPGAALSPRPGPAAPRRPLEDPSNGPGGAEQHLSPQRRFEAQRAVTGRSRSPSPSAAPPPPRSVRRPSARRSPSGVPGAEGEGRGGRRRRRIPPPRATHLRPPGLRLLRRGTGSPGHRGDERRAPPHRAAATGCVELSLSALTRQGWRSGSRTEKGERQYPATKNYNSRRAPRAAGSLRPYGAGRAGHAGNGSSFPFPSRLASREGAQRAGAECRRPFEWN